MTKEYRPIFVSKASNSTKPTEFLICSRTVKSAWILSTSGFKTFCISNAPDGTEDYVVWGTEDAGEASNEDDCSGSSDKDAVCGIG